jgi:hypothetical protein
MAAYGDRINNMNVSRVFVFDNPGERALPKSLVPGWPNPLLAAWSNQGRFFREFVGDIPNGATVSSPEWLMPALVQRPDVALDYAPIGLGKNRYMILIYNSQQSGELRLEVPSFRSGDEVAKIRSCIQSGVDAAYDVWKQQEHGGGRYRIYALKKS